MHSPLVDDPTQPTAVTDRRRNRVHVPECPSCRVPLTIDVRSSDTLYARCPWCGHRRLVSKPTSPSRE
jgi:DNA-directed RNA polymerase subunit RPC12/RpoP